MSVVTGRHSIKISSLSDISGENDLLFLHLPNTRGSANNSFCFFFGVTSGDGCICLSSETPAEVSVRGVFPDDWGSSMLVVTGGDSIVISSLSKGSGDNDFFLHLLNDRGSAIIVVLLMRGDGDLDFFE